MKAYRYFLVQLKLCIRNIPAVLILVALLFFLLSSFFSGNVKENSEVEREKIKLGVVGNSENRLINFGVDFLKNADQSKDYLDVQLFDSKEKAVELVESGELAACIVVSDDFIDNIRHGENLSLDFVTKKGTVDLSSSIINDVVITVSRMVVDVQSIAFTSEEYLENVAGLEDKKLMNKINFYLLERVLSRNELVRNVEVSKNGVSLGGYYFCSLIILAVVFLGIVNAPLLSKNNTDFHRLLSVGGCGEIYQIVLESTSYILSVLFEIFVLLIAFGFFIGEKI